MKTILLESDINYLGIDEKIIKFLNNNNIFFIKDLWNLDKKDLKNFGLTLSEINKIVVKMQLVGLDLNKKIYR